MLKIIYFYVNATIILASDLFFNSVPLCLYLYNLSKWRSFASARGVHHNRRYGTQIFWERFNWTYYIVGITTKKIRRRTLSLWYQTHLSIRNNYTNSLDYCGWMLWHNSSTSVQQKFECYCRRWVGMVKLFILTLFLKT